MVHRDLKEKYALSSNIDTKKLYRYFLVPLERGIE